MTSNTLRAKAYLALEEAIVTRQLAPGSRVTELELSQRLGIGRTPTREALQRLSSEGLVTIRPRDAILIEPMTLQRLRQLLELREAVERLLVTSAARRASLDERARALALANAVLDAADLDLALYLRVVRDANELLCEAGRNEFLAKTMAEVYGLSRLFAYPVIKARADRQEAAERHGAILKAVAAQDVAQAEQAASDMIAYLKRRYGPDAAGLEAAADPAP